MLGLLAICTLFVAAGLWMVSSGQSDGWLGIMFFGLGVVVSITQLLPNASYLLLTENGFKVRSLYRSWFVWWDEVSHFASANISHNNMIVFVFSERYEKGKLSRKLARAMTGYEGALPETYGMKAEELAELLNQWKERFCSRHSSAGVRVPAVR